MEAKPRDLVLDLSDDILLHIFSFLQVKDILRLRVLSKSFNKTLCAATLSFCFSDGSDPDNCLCEHVFDFMKNRPHALIVNRISLSSFCNKLKHGEIHEQWIIQLFEVFCVNELSLDFKLPSIFGSLPKFQSLRVLKLNMNQFDTVVKLPKMKLPSLETLQIQCIRVNASFGEWIFKSFPSLKHQFLQKLNIFLSQGFTIQSSSLEVLAFYGCTWFGEMRIIAENLRSLDCYFGDVSKCCIGYFHLKTTAPKLQSLSWVGDSDPNRLHHDEEMFQNLQITTLSRFLIMREPSYCVINELFNCLHSARELHIDTEVLQLWMPIHKFTDYHGEALIENLHHLEIHVRSYIDADNYITFLEKSSNSETLTLVDYQNDGSEVFYLNEQSVEDDFKKALRDCGEDEVRRTKGLKKVKLIIRDFNYNMVILIGWLMKSCVDLEEIRLHYPYCYHRSMMREGLQYLESFQRASPQPPSFYFLPNKNASISHQDLVIQPRLLRKRNHSTSSN